MHSDPVYGFALTPDGNGGYVGQQKSAPSSYGSYSSPGGASFTDAFHRNRVPSAKRLVEELVGLVFACATLNAEMVGKLRPHLFCITRKGQPKHRFVQAFERQKGYSVSSGVNSRTLKYLQGHANGHPGLSKDGYSSLSGVPGYTLTGDVKVEEIYEHPLLDLLNKPEATEDDIGLSGINHRITHQLYMEIVGRAYLLKEMGPQDRPKNLWLMQAQHVTEVIDTTGEKFLSHYQIGSRRYTAKELIKCHIPDLAHPRIGGFSPLMAAFEKIGLIRKGDAQINAVLENMGFPGLIATPKPTETGTYMGAPEARRTTAALNSVLRQGGAGSAIVLPEPLELIFPHWKPNETLSLDRYKQYKTDICNCFGCPTSVLERNDSNFASAKTGDYAHSKYAGLPRVARYEAMVNNELVPLYDKENRLFFALDNVIPEDEVFELEQHRSIATLGGFSIDELREAAGEPRIGGPLGDARYINGNLIGENGVPIMAVQQGPSPGTTNRDVPPPKKDDTKKMVFITESLRQILKSIETPQSPQITVNVPPAAKDANSDELAKTVREISRTLPKLARLLNDSKSHADLSQPGHGARTDSPAPGQPAESDHPAADARPSDPCGNTKGASGDACAVHADAGRHHPPQLDGQSVKAALLAAGYDESEVTDKMTARAVEHVEL